MREIVIVISDLYLPTDLEAAVSDQAARVSLPGIEQVTRFAASAPLQASWRDWVARWLGLARYANLPVASVAAAAQQLPAGLGCWLATPLHLIEGLTRVHVEWRCLLRLGREDRERLAAGFTETFQGSGFDLIGIDSGELLLTAPALGPIRTTEPTRLALADMAESLPRGEGAAALRRLGAELEMWLHAHPLNAERVRRGEPPVSTLWIWGGGEPPVVAPPGSGAEITVFGSDAYVNGLCHLAGLESRLMSAGLPADGARPTLCVLAVADALQSDARSSLADALQDLDRRAVAPAVEALRRGEIDRLALLANDRRWLLRASDRWRLWRRKRAGLEALQ